MLGASAGEIQPAYDVTLPVGFVARQRMFCAEDQATLRPEPLLETIRAAVKAAGRSVEQEFSAPQPPDFSTSREEPGWLKSVWLRLR